MFIWGRGGYYEKGKDGRVSAASSRLSNNNQREKEYSESKIKKLATRGNETTRKTRKTRSRIQFKNR